MSQISKRGCATFFPAVDDPLFDKRNDAIGHTVNGIHNHIEWAKTDRGGRQYSLITLADFGTACNQWGACEV